MATLASRGVQVRRAGRGLPRVRLDREGAARRARGDRRGRRADRCARRGTCSDARRRDRRPDVRGHRSGPLHRQPVERPHGLRDRGRSRRAAARTSCSSPGRRRSSRRPGADSMRVRSARGDARAIAGTRRRRRRGRCHHGGRGGRLHACGRRGRREDREAGRPAHGDPGAHGGHPRGARTRRAAARRPRCSSASPPRPAIRVPRARQKRAAKQVDLIVANDVSRDGRRLRRGDQRRLADRGRRRESKCRSQLKTRARRDDPRSRRAACSPSSVRGSRSEVARPASKSDAIDDAIHGNRSPNTCGSTRSSACRASAATSSAASRAREAARRTTASRTSEPRDLASRRTTAFAAPDDPGRRQERHRPACTRCKLHTLGRKQVVFGVGNPDADLMFVGEAPGADEDVQGIPFVGRAGQLLTKMIEAIDLRREDVYIANVIKCRPPGNRNPEPDEIAQCEPFLFQQIEAIKPKVIVALGTFAAQDAAAGARTPISRLRGQHLRFPRRQADADVPPVVPAAQSRPQARRLGGHEEGARPPDLTRHAARVGSPPCAPSSWPCPCRDSAP